MKVALIGHGYWGTILERYIKADNNYQLKYVCDSKTNLDEVWNDDEVEAVVIAVRNEQRFPIVRQALLHRKNVLTEKPLALTTLEAWQLTNLAKEMMVSLAVDYTFTFSKSLKLAQTMINGGKIGKLLGFDMRVDHLAPFGGGSVYWILGSHCLSALDMFIPLKSMTYKKEDVVVYEGVTETGVITTDKGQIHLSLNYPDKMVEFVFYGEQGTIVYNPNRRESLIVENYERVIWAKGDDVPKKRELIQLDEGNNLRYVMEYFHDVIQGKSKSNADTAVGITRILERLQNESNT